MSAAPRRSRKRNSLRRLRLSKSKKSWRRECGLRKAFHPQAHRACSAEFDGYSSDELVKAVMSGNQEPRSTDITEARARARSAGSDTLLGARV